MSDDFLCSITKIILFPALALGPGACIYLSFVFMLVHVERAEKNEWIVMPLYCENRRANEN